MPTIRPPRSGVGLALLLAVTLLAPHPALAQSPRVMDFGGDACGAEFVHRTSDYTEPLLPVTLPVVEARIVYVSFPGYTGTTPSWKQAMVDSIDLHFETMSRGQQAMNLSVISPPGSPDSVWMADHTSMWYVQNGGFGALNYEIMQKVATRIANVWDGVDHAFMIHYQCTFPCTDPSSEQNCENTCPWGGVASLQIPNPVPGFTGGGGTQRFWYPNIENPPQYPWFNHFEVQMNVAVHELGHDITADGNFTGHSPGSGSGGAFFVNYGRYDVLRDGQFATNSRQEGALPYNGPELSRWNRLPTTQVTTDTRDVRIPDALGPSGILVRVDAPGGNNRQTYMLANFQATNPFDVHFRGRGLLIWHAMRNTTGAAPWEAGFWDLECAGGKFTAGSPDPASGKDALEADPNALGSAADFFDGVTRTTFNCSTNPNTKLYSTSFYTSAQTVATSVAFENIRREAATGDMLVDVYLTPKQYVASPNGGEILEQGTATTITWNVRPTACMTNVDVLVSSNSGGSWSTLAAGISNSGSLAWTPTATGSKYRVKVVSRDQAGGTGEDISDADFEVTESGKWLALGGTGSGREQGASTFDPIRHRTLVFGGSNGTTLLNDVGAVSATGTWSAVTTSGTAPSARRASAAMYDRSRDRMVIFGGYSHITSLLSVLSDTWALDLATGAWSQLAVGSPGPIFYGTNAIYDPTRDRMVVTEGTGVVYALSFATNTWSTLAYSGLNLAGGHHFTAAYDSLGDQAVVFSGWYDHPVPAQRNTQGVSLFPFAGAGANAWANDVADGTDPAKRSFATAIYEPTRDRLVTFGGTEWNASGAYYNDAQQLSLSGSGAPKWFALSPFNSGPSARAGHAAAYDRKYDRMILTNGRTTSGLSSDIWALCWDVQPPGQVTTFNPTGGCEHLDFSWMATGDDGAIGTPVEYDLRASTTALTEANWSSATTVASGPSVAAGQTEYIVLNVGACSAKKYYGVKIRDENYNWSPLSNTSWKMGTPCPPPMCEDVLRQVTMNLPAAMSLAATEANPTRTPFPVQFSIPLDAVGQSYEVAVYDPSGRLVRRLQSGLAEAGNHSEDWNLQNDTGRRVPAGVYFVSFRLGEKRQTQSVIVLR